MSSLDEQSAFRRFLDLFFGIFSEKSVEDLYRNTFEKYATVKQHGQLYMNLDNFINAIVPEEEDCYKIKREDYFLIFRVADVNKRGLLSLQDWICFENLLAKHDAENEIVFRIFDVNGTGSISCDDFRRMIFENRSFDIIPFNWESSCLRSYVGDVKKCYITAYPQFIQMLEDLQEERINQAFMYYDKKNTGYIEPGEFFEIINKMSSHKLSDYLLENLHTLCNIGNVSKISYANMRAFQNLVRKMNMIKNIVRTLILKSTDGKITKDDFLKEVGKMDCFSFFTPMEIDILFHFAGLDNDTGRLTYQDFMKVLDASWKNPVDKEVVSSSNESRIINKYSKTKKIFLSLLESVYHFSLGAIAGASGAIVVYPIDLVKTRVQNVRTRMAGQMLYRNSFDCVKKVLKNEGVFGFYSGLGLQLIGVVPEKAIKLTVNDLIRHLTKNDDGNIRFHYEILAGAFAGGSQVVFTNPLEIVKIRLQIQGELVNATENVPRRNALWIIKDLGFIGLYRGVSACLLRDIPFSAIYFPVYSHLKKDYFKESSQKRLGIKEHFISGAVADARKGETNYKGIRHAFFTIIKEEGFTALFKGGPARVVRSSPQFACTLAVYEALQTLFSKHKYPSYLADGLDEKKVSLSYLRSRNALKVILVGRLQIIVF
ncbi:hypothetical protein PMAC_000509 [Pneumocystis sp. 'macacae']|nr:hypothetical protein PMAC_000509 [Pneumocystis sp. 'macacae']